MKFEFDEVPLLLTAEQVAGMLNISVRSVWRLRSAGMLPEPVKVGGNVRWNARGIREWIAQGCPRP